MATVSFRIDDELKERLDYLAGRRGLNISHLFRQAIVDQVNDLEGVNERTNLSFSLKERLALANQYEILANTTKNKHQAEQYRRYAEALQEGFEFHYRDLFDMFSDVMSREDCIEVFDILEMFSDLLYSYDRLTDKAGIDAHGIRFPGFDGQHEAQRWRYIRFIFADGKFSTVHESAPGHDFNSHMPVLDIYRRMLVVWRKDRNPSRVLSAENIKAIDAARVRKG